MRRKAIAMLNAWFRAKPQAKEIPDPASGKATRRSNPPTQKDSNHGKS